MTFILCMNEMFGRFLSMGIIQCLNSVQVYNILSYREGRTLVRYILERFRFNIDLLVFCVPTCCTILVHRPCINQMFTFLVQTRSVQFYLCITCKGTSKFTCILRMYRFYVSTVCCRSRPWVDRYTPYAKLTWSNH